jgi:hypothetical protein
LGVHQDETGSAGLTIDRYPCQQSLCHKLTSFGYNESTNTPGLWHHESRPITFGLVVDDFGVKFVNKDNVDHLVSSIKKAYTPTKDWTGNLYFWIMLEWDYVNCTVEILMPGYIKNKLQEYEHATAKKLQTCPYSSEPKKMARRHRPPSPLTNYQDSI